MSNKLVAELKKLGDTTIQAFKGLEDLQSRIESIEAAGDRPRGDTKGRFSKEETEHKGAFLDWLRKPRDGMLRRNVEEAEHEMKKAVYGTKAVSIGTNSSGGYAVPTEIDSQIESRVRILNPFRSLVRTTTVGTSDFKQLVSRNDASSGWVGEGDARSETTTSSLIECAPSFGTIYAYPKASEESMQDVFFDVQAWLVEEVSDGFSAAEATAIVSGDGTSKPSGFLNTTPTDAEDTASPERAATALQFLPLTSSPQAITADNLIDLSLSIKERYLLDGASVAWTMRRSTAAIVRKLKDDNGAYLWQPSLQAGQPNMLLGYPVALTDAMPAATEGLFPIAFGNWRRGYLLADRSGLEITVDANITTPGQVKFYVRRRVGGKVLNHQAIKLLKFAD